MQPTQPVVPTSNSCGFDLVRMPTQRDMNSSNSCATHPTLWDGQVQQRPSI